MLDSQNSCTLPAMITSSFWNVYRLRYIHKRVMQTLLRICHMRVHTAVYAVTSSGWHRSSLAWTTANNLGARLFAQLAR